MDEDDLKFIEPAERGLFIQENVNSWRYFGLYRVHRNAGSDLSKEEWQAFDESVGPTSFNHVGATVLTRFLVQAW